MAFNLEKFLFDTPIYIGEKIGDGEIDSTDFDSLFYTSYARNIEGYNSFRKTQSTFSVARSLSYDNTEMKSKGGQGTVHITCKRYGDVFRFFINWDPKERLIIKVGQFPTVADFHLAEVKQYNKVIHEEKLKELTRAIGLAANGVGIGSFVYLRRIFEHLINDAFTKALLDNAVSEETFQKARMDQKIDLLHGYLPTFLVENKGMYSILSLGIHELDEKTCLAHFDTLRVGIEIILDEKLDEQRKREKIELAKQKLNSLKGEIKK